MTSRNRKRLGEFLILLVYLLIDGYSLWDITWPLPHFWALFAGVIGIIALLLLDGEFGGQRIFIYSGAATIVALSIYLFSPAVLPPETETHGWLLPANDPTPHVNSCQDNANFPKHGLSVFLGKDSIVAADVKYKFGIIGVGCCSQVRVQRIDNRLSIDADIVDAAGHLVARIRNNEFHIAPGEMSYEERPDRSTLAVYNVFGKQVFWIKYLNPNAARIRGVFACRNVGPLVITDDRITCDMCTPPVTIRRACVMNIGQGYESVGIQVAPYPCYHPD